MPTYTSHKLKRILKNLGVFALLLALAISGVTYYFYKHIKPILVSEINKTLVVEVNVADISISGLRDFPKLGIKFLDIEIDESTPYFKQKLVKAEELNLFIDVLKLYKGEYVIDGVTLRNGMLNVADLKKGTNYDILTPSTDENSSAVSFEIQNLSLINCEIAYEHTPSKFKLSGYSSSTSIGLKRDASISSISIKTKLDSTYIALASDVFLAKKNLKINTALDINTDNEVINIAQSELLIEEVKLTTKGTVSYGKNSSVDITFANDKTTTASLLSVFPSSIATLLKGITLDGNVVLNGYFKGKTDSKNNPSFGFDYTLENTQVIIEDQNIKLEDINASGRLNLPNIAKLSNASATCKLEKANNSSNQIAGDISVVNFDRPNIKWDGNADLDAGFVMTIADYEGLKISGGTIKVEGKLELTYDVKKGELAKNSLRYTAKVLANNLKGKLNSPEIDIKDITLDLSADNDKMVVNNASFEYNNTKGILKGILENYQSLGNENSNATLVGNLIVNGLVVNQLYGERGSTTTETKSSGDLIPIKLRLKAELTNFQYNDFTAKSLKGNLLSNRVKIEMPKCEVIALDGITIASIGLKKWGENYLLDINSDIKKVNITKLFRQFNNFEQSEITDKHLSGQLSGNIITKVILDNNYEPILPKLYAKANFIIENGALIGYEPLKELSAFVNVSDLENVKFKTLQNTIEIFDQTIFIPKMRIENNALNLELEGTHTFENYMRYTMGLSIAELMATKANWIAKKKEKRIEKNVNGGLTAYIMMEGTPDDLKIKYDRATVKENVKVEAKKEKEKFIKALKGEGTLEEKADAKDYDNVWDE